MLSVIVIRYTCLINAQVGGVRIVPLLQDVRRPLQVIDYHYFINREGLHQ